MKKKQIAIVIVLALASALLLFNLSREMPTVAFGIYCALLALLVAMQIMVDRLAMWLTGGMPAAERVVSVLSALATGVFVYLFAQYVYPGL